MIQQSSQWWAHDIETARPNVITEVSVADRKGPREPVSELGCRDASGLPSWTSSCPIAGDRETTSGASGTISKPAESARSLSGIGVQARTKCACIGRHAPPCSGSETTGTCCPKRRRPERPCGMRSIRIQGSRRLGEAFPEPIRAGQRDEDMKIKLVNGSVWQLVGSDNFNSLVGAGPQGVQ